MPDKTRTVATDAGYCAVLPSGVLSVMVYSGAGSLTSGTLVMPGLLPSSNLRWSLFTFVLLHLSPDMSPGYGHVSVSLPFEHQLKVSVGLSLAPANLIDHRTFTKSSREQHATLARSHCPFPARFYVASSPFVSGSSECFGTCFR